VRSYKQFCPVAKASEVLAERWTLLIVREMLMGSTRYGELQWGIPGIPRSLLAQRLRSLELAGIVEIHPGDRRGNEYVLTAAGEELLEVIEKLGEWGERWVNHDISDEEVVDASLLMWDMRRRINWENVPPERVTVRFDIEGARHNAYWLVLHRGEAEVCLQDPGYDVDLHVESDTRTLHLWWLGRLPYTSGVREGRIRLDGPRRLVSGFPSWLATSVFAPVQPMPRTT
jgi:DNA-binding HxlR family transcriptional regulator